MGKEVLYAKLSKAYAKAYYHESKQKIQKNVNEIWTDKKRKDLPEIVDKLVHEYDVKARKREAKVRQFWISVPQKKTSHCVENTAVLQNMTNVNSSLQTSSTHSSEYGSSEVAENGSENHVPLLSFKKPAQDSLRQRIGLVSADLCVLYERRNLDMLTPVQFKDLKAKESQKAILEAKLRIRIRDQSRQKKRREIAKKKIAKLMSTVNPQNENFIKLHPRAGRPRLESDQPLLLKAICDIAIHGSGAHERRRCDVLRSVKTLDELLQEVKSQGFQISRSGLYLRLLPKNYLTTEGKRHVVTVPVKLIGAQNDKHESHVDGQFCASTIRNLEELASLLGPNEVFFLSQDDKAKVSIGVTAAKKQAPILMHMEYKVTLPDHDFVVAAKHKLTPSVYAAIVIKPNGFGKPEAVTYSGPTYIAVRSGIHFKM